MHLNSVNATPNSQKKLAYSYKNTINRTTEIVKGFPHFKKCKYIHFQKEITQKK